MKTIAIIAQKGGASKTTIALHLAVEAERKGKKTAVIDIDPQASASKWGDIRKAETPAIVSAQASRLEFVIETAKGQGVDILIIDTAPHSGNDAVKVARLADLVLIPTKTGILDLQAVENSVEIARLGKKHPTILLTAVPHKGSTAQDAREALGYLQAEICPLTIGDRADYRNALALGLTAQEYEPKGKASQEAEELYKWVAKKIQ